MNKTTILSCVILAAGAIAQAAPATKPATTSAPKELRVIDKLYKPHPRLMLHDDQLAALRKSLDADKDLKRCLAQVIEQADKILKQPMLERKLIGPRLLNVSRECVKRVYTLGLAWRFTGDAKYAKCARDNLLAVCAFEDWNPSHFLDVAEMSHGVGVGYDWFHSQLDAPTRKTIREALVKHGLAEGLKAYEQDKGWFHKSAHNWNQVCNGGLLAGALAIADEEPDIGQRIVSAAIKSLPLALASYAPDGAWGEGPGYWSYATNYTAYGLAALQSALGDDAGLSLAAGLDKAGHFPIQVAGPEGLKLNFADVGDRSKLGPDACMFWLARTYKDDTLAAAEHAELDKRSCSPLHVVWWVPRPADAAKRLAALPLDARFRGHVDVATFRSAWQAGAVFAGIKAGYNQVNHGHLDLGNFEMDALGVRWVRDLGKDDYNLPGYWLGQTAGGKRWSYYRNNSLSHSVPLLSEPGKPPANQAHDAKASMTKFSTGPAPSAVVDFSSAYAPLAASALRGLALVQGRRAVLVQDEFEFSKPADFVWGMTTDAAITTDGPRATLKLGGKELQVEILSPAGAAFSTESAEQAKPQTENKGVSRLLVKLPNQTGKLRLAVQLSPVSGQQIPPAPVVPLEKW